MTTEDGQAERWGVDHDGSRVEVEREPSGLGQVLRLVVDGEQRAETKTNGGRTKLEDGQLTVEVRLAALGSIRRAALLDAGGEELVLLDPPPGTRAARLAELERRRPVLYAARHVVKAVGSVLLPLLGIGALIGLVLPALPDIDLPQVNLPDVSLPDLPDLPSTSIEPPEWVKSVLSAAPYVVPIVIAIGVAAREVERQRKRRRRAEDGSA
ncbi:MAG: hypothetical protein ABWZ03_06790 [Solirubrobacterales bacterium]